MQYNWGYRFYSVLYISEVLPDLFWYLVGIISEVQNILLLYFTILYTGSKYFVLDDHGSRTLNAWGADILVI